MQHLPHVHKKVDVLLWPANVARWNQKMFLLFLMSPSFVCSIDVHTQKCSNHFYQMFQWNRWRSACCRFHGHSLFVTRSHYSSQRKCALGHLFHWISSDFDTRNETWKKTSSRFLLRFLNTTISFSSSRIAWSSTGWSNRLLIVSNWFELIKRTLSNFYRVCSGVVP